MNTPQGTHLRQLANILRRRWKLMAAAALAGAALAVVVGLLLGPRYTAKAQIVVDSRKATSAGEQAAAGPNGETIVETQVAMIVSNIHLQRVFDSFVAAAKGEPTEIGDQLTSSDFARLELESLRRHLKAFAERRSWVIGITFTSSNPAMAAAVANRTAQLYVRASADFDRDNRQETLASLAERIPLARAHVEKADAALQSHRIMSGFPEPNHPDAVDQQIVDLNRQLAVANSELASRQARLPAVRNSQHHEANRMPALIDIVDKPSLRELDRAYPGAPRPGSLTMPPRLDGDLQKIRAGIGQAATDTPLQEANETDVIESRIRSLQQRLATLQNASIETRQRQVRLRELQREATAATEAYERLLQRQSQMLVERDGAPEVRVLSFASIPEFPSSPHPALFVLPGLLVALIGAGLLAVVLEGLDQSLRSERDVEDALGISCIGLIPRVVRKRRMRPHQHLLKWPSSRYAEGVRSVVTSALELTNPRGAPKVFLVTSSVRGEGKSTLACSFAVYAAMLHRRVLLIDLDLRCSTTARQAEGMTDGGIADVLRGRPLTEVIRSIPELGVDYLPASCPVDPLALIADDELAKLLRNLRDSYDCIVIDSAPLLGRTEARVLASNVDRVLFAVRWGSTRPDIAQNALSMISHSEARGRNLRNRVRAVITQADLKRHARHRFGDFSEALFHYRAAG